MPEFQFPPNQLICTKLEFSNQELQSAPIGGDSQRDLETQGTIELSKPHYKPETAPRTESTKAATKIKVTEATPPVVDDVEVTPTAEIQADIPVCQDELRTRAFLKWEAAGKPEGDGICFWLDAEQELLGSK